MTKQQALSQTPLFSALTKDEIDALAAVTVEKSYHAGETLFSEGEPCSGLFILGRGTVKIVKTAATGRQIMLAVESAPSSVAEVPLFDGGTYPASVTAIEDTAAYLILKADFHGVCRRHPEVPLKVLAVVGKRLRQLVGLVEGVTFGSVRQRLAKVILEFGEDAFVLPVTHEELAFRLGTVREVVSRNLSRFQAEKLIRVQRREIQILDRERLQAEADTEL